MEPPLSIEFLYFEDCPSHEPALARLRAALARHNMTAAVNIIKIETEAQARQRQFIGSPTILINGRDIDPPRPGTPPALTCRVYRLDDGRVSPLPSVEMMDRALRPAAK